MFVDEKVRKKVMKEREEKKQKLKEKKQKLAEDIKEMTVDKDKKKEIHHEIEDTWANWTRKQRSKWILEGGFERMKKKHRQEKEVPTIAAKGGRIKAQFGYNSGRTNLLDEARRIRTEPQTRNVLDEERRVRGELSRGLKKGGKS